jgi:hypothetical protein
MTRKWCRGMQTFRWQPKRSDFSHWAPGFKVQSRVTARIRRTPNGRRRKDQVDRVDRHLVLLVIAFPDIVRLKSMKAPGRTTTVRLEMQWGEDLDSAISTLIANISC